MRYDRANQLYDIYIYIYIDGFVWKFGLLYVYIKYDMYIYIYMGLPGN